MANSGHEIVTLGLGNFASLTCAQWVNGLTRYDAEHCVAFSETRKGAGFAPRLLLLDAGHPSVIAEERNLSGVAGAPGVHGFSDEEVNEAILRHVARRGDDSDDDDSSNADGGNKAECEVESSSQRRHADPNSGHEARTDNAGDKDAEAEAPPLWVTDDPLVPWHLYIKTPLHPRTYGHLRHSHNDPRGLALLHSYGHGLSAMHPERREECADLVDRVRHQLEACDACQGVQFFVDADGAFGGAAQRQLAHFRDDYGSGIPLLVSALFNPPTFSTDDDFCRQRRQEVVLNEALSFANLPDLCDLYTPFNVPTWRTWAPATNASGGGSPSPLCPERIAGNDVAAAQLIATTVDTAMYACRQERFEEFLPMRQFCALLRPERALGVCSSLIALPSGHFATSGRPAHLWGALEAMPLMATRHFRPLSFATPQFKGCKTGDSVYPFNDSRSLVLSHAFSLRGFGGFPDEVYPRDEALMRYALPLRSSKFEARIFVEPYPLSDTFPRDALLQAPTLGQGGQDERQSGTGATPSTVRSVSHLACTFAAGPHIAKVASEAHEICGRWRHAHAETYAMERDEWGEALEALDCLRNEYDREIPDGDDDVE